MIQRYAWLMILAALFLAGTQTACRPKPPEQERMLAEKLFKEAMIGKDCDRENYLAAEELLNTAREEVNRKNYEKAKELFETARKKAQAIVEYVRKNPDKCDPDRKKKDATDKTAPVEDEAISSETLSATDPNLKFPRVHFAFNEYTVRAEDIPHLDLMAAWLTNFPEAALRIEGHADERGSVDYNLSLGERRAQTVRDELIRRGIDQARLRIISYGEERPIATGATEEAWFQNRRAEFVRTN